MKKKTVGTLALSGGQATLTFETNSVLNKAIAIVFSGNPDFQSTAATSPKRTQRSLKSLARPMVAMLKRMTAFRF
jgi:hypothetical protein